tara:strand:- start:1490 stop:1846 length:357 start_codon:yes stop_codon:yes gene_type:complete
MISKLISLIDNELYCEVHLKEDDSYFFPAEDYYDNDGNYGDLLVRSRRSNWDTILEMVPLIGEASVHHLMLTEGVEEPERPPIIEYYEHWRRGIYWLNCHGFKIDQVECYRRMIKNLS